jgi:hypothetical protein
LIHHTKKKIFNLLKIDLNIRGKICRKAKPTHTQDLLDKLSRIRGLMAYWNLMGASKVNRENGPTVFLNVMSQQIEDGPSFILKPRKIEKNETPY